MGIDVKSGKLEVQACACACSHSGSRSGISDTRGTMPLHPLVRLQCKWWMLVLQLKCQGRRCTSMLSAGSAPSSRATRRFFLTPRSSVMPPSVDFFDLSPDHAECRGMGYPGYRRSPSSWIRRMRSNLDVPSTDRWNRFNPAIAW